LEPLTQLDGVAARLNRLALQKALYRTLGVALIAAAVCGWTVSSLAPRPFAALSILAGILVAVVAAESVRQLRTDWADRLGAARWIERKVDLEQRLLTLVSAPTDARSGRLWQELEEDNRLHAPLWQPSALRIPTIPTNFAILAVGLVAALAALSLDEDEPEMSPPPPALVDPAAADPQGAMPRPKTEGPESRARRLQVPAPGPGSTTETRERAGVARPQSALAPGQGARPGAGAATEPLRPGRPGSPLERAGIDRFSLPLGAVATEDSKGEGRLVGRSAPGFDDVERGPQDDGVSIQRQNIPPEYEPVIRRIFERNP
jgi:hypothetical protein